MTGNARRMPSNWGISAMNFWTIRNLLILVYLVGNALTYRNLVKADPSPALDTGTMLRNLGVSFLWPLYWLINAVP